MGGRYQTKHEVRHIATGPVDRPSASHEERTSSFQADQQNSMPLGRTPGTQTHRRLERLAIRPIARLITRREQESNGGEKSSAEDAWFQHVGEGGAHQAREGRRGCPCSAKAL